MLAGFSFQPLAKHHDRERFTCEEDALNEYLKRVARGQDENNTTRLHVYANEAGEIAGYYTLASLSLDLTGLPVILQRGRPRLPVPATLLGRLARDLRYRGAGLGPFLLSHALRNAYEANRISSAAFLVVDSKPHALDFYRENAPDFMALPGCPMRLVLPMEAIGRELGY